MQHRSAQLKQLILASASAVTMIAAAPQVTASGFAVPELSTTGLALSNALVANPRELGALPYNPAAMAFHEGSSVSVNGFLLKPNMSVKTGNGQFDSDANDWVFIPALSAHHQMTETTSIGIAINAPFGLETDWPADTFVRSTDNPGGYPPVEDPPIDPPNNKINQVPTNSKLEVIDISPALAFKINENTSLSVGLDIYWVRDVKLISKVNTLTFPKVNLQGDGKGTGFHIGGLYVNGPWSFGANYHSASNVPIDGEAKSPAGNTDATVRLELPSRLQLGVRHQTTEQLAFEFDYTRTGWSSFDTLDIKEATYGSTIDTSANKWDDANAYRLGVTYDLTGKTQLRFGYTYDETPQGDDYFSPRVPDADRQLYSIGIGHKLKDGWSIDAGYMFVNFDKRTINSNREVVPGEETNGSTAVNGTYDSNVSLLGIGINKTFM